MLTVISGGTGTPKLLQGLMELVPQRDISVIVNTGEDAEVSGLKVCPDLDTVVYTLVGIIDDEDWHGIKGDSFHVHETLRELGHEEILKIGDRDRGVQLYRTMRMREGASLSQVTRELCEGLGVGANVMPMSDDQVTTRIRTDRGEISFQEFWVVRRAEDRVVDVNFLDADQAEPAPGVISALEDSQLIIVGPSNPITSIGPILAIDEIREGLRRNRKKVLAVSPVLGDSPVSGPTGVLMEGLGHEVSPLGVAKIYGDFVSTYLLHQGDEEMSSDIRGLGMEVYIGDLLIPDISSRIELAKEILEIADYPIVHVNN